MTHNTIDDSELSNIFSSLQVSFPNSVEDISYFFSISNKNKNDKVNKIRESIIESIHLIPSSYTSHQKYCEKWYLVQSEFYKIFNINDSQINIIKLAGRKYNYDFILSFSNTTLKIEFKFNCCSIFKLPQIIQISDHTLFRYSYAEFYYDNYLNNICQELGISTTIVKDDYLKLVYKTDSKAHLLFQELNDCYKTSPVDRKKIQKTSKESISAYLQKYYRHLNLSKLSEYLTKALDKTYLLWYKNTFVTQQIIDSFKKVNIISIKNNNTIIVQSSYEYCLLLRWKNHIGVLNPCWQISVKEISKTK